MRSRLDLIEARLQAFIESSGLLFVREGPQQRLAHELVEAATGSLETNGDGRVIAPSQYTIFLHPDSLTFWRSRHALLDNVSRHLQEAAREYGIHFTSQPEFELVPDPALPLEGMRVSAGGSSPSGGQTAALPVAPATSTLNIPHNAFLIIEGDRVFTLDRMVINIGRRADNHLVLSDPRISRAHAQIRAIRGQYVLFDLNSTGGTMVNGHRIQRYVLKPGDVISLSGVPLVYGEDPQTGDESEQMGYTRGMENPNREPPEIIT